MCAPPLATGRPLRASFPGPGRTRTHWPAASLSGLQLSATCTRPLTARSKSPSPAQTLHTAPHARFDCAAKPFNKQAGLDVCRQTCDHCFCWVCDVPHKECTSWDEHCLCDGSPEWNVMRQRIKRQREQALRDRQDAIRGVKPPSTQEQVAARYAQAQQAPAPRDVGAAEEDREQQAEDEEVEEIFSQYEPLHLHEGQPHPDPVVETTSLAFAELPPITLSTALPKAIFKPRTDANPHGGALSRLQIETVAYAAMRHGTTLPTGQTAGFFLGDGVGLGKGRQLAGVILDNWKQGRKRHLWVSVSADLMQDAIRDLTDIGAAEIKVVNLVKCKSGPTISEIKEGVVFSTYMGLVAKSGRHTREQQIVNWLGKENADGCMLFDESHKAKNLVADDDKASNGNVSAPGARPPRPAKSTKMALTVASLQTKCPKARVVYCSATGAGSLANMAYMERLGLWGPQTPFSNFGAFKSAMGNGQNVGAMELVALDMKRRGMYISRQLSFASAEQHQEIVDLTPEQTSMYDAACVFWQELHACFEHAMTTLDVKGLNQQIAQENRHRKKEGLPPLARHPAGHVMTHYWGCHQRFFRQMCMAIKVPRVRKIAQEALAEDKCVVIGLQTTGESRLNDAVKDDCDLDEYSGMREVVRFLLERFPTGDYLSKHPEPAEDDEDDEDDAEDAVQAAGGEAMQRAYSRRAVAARRRAGEDVDTDSEDDDDGADLRGFIARDDEEDEGDDSDASGDSDASDMLEGDAPRAKLPDAVKALPKAQLRRLLDEARIKHAQCTNASQLLARLRRVPNVAELYARVIQGAGSSADGAAGSSGGEPVSGGKRKSSGSVGSASSSSSRKRPSPNGASSSVVDVDAEDDAEDGADVAMEDDDAMVDGSSNGLVGRRVSVRRDGSPQVGTVVDYAADGKKHRVRFDGADGAVWLRLTDHEWNIEAGKAAPGAAGQTTQGGGGGARASKSSGAKKPARRIADSDDSDDAEMDEAENVPPQAKGKSSKGKAAPAPAPLVSASGRPTRAAGRAATTKARKQSKATSDSDDSWEESDDSDDDDDGEEDEEDDDAMSDDASDSDDSQPRGRSRGKAKAKPKAKPKAKAKAAAKQQPKPSARALAKAPAKPAAKGRGGGGGGRRSRQSSGDSQDGDDDDDVDSLLGDDDEDGAATDLSRFQHRDPYQIRHLQSMRRQMKRKLDRLNLPDNPLDTLIHELGGAKMVAELTGRKGRLERNAKGHTVYVKRTDGEVDASTGRQVAMERINLHEKAAFMSGEKLVAIISEAASSGISLQADRRVKNTRRRVHITLELPWSADQAIQQCGRTHRSNQIHGPQYVLMMTACGGERRFASTVAKRLQSLGALTRGDRRAADAADLSEFDVDTKWGGLAMKEVVEACSSPAYSATIPPADHVRDALGLKRNGELQEKWTAYLEEADDALAATGITVDKLTVKHFLNRMLGMKVATQNRLFGHFTAVLDHTIKKAKEDHKFDDGVVDIRGNNVKLEPGYPKKLGVDALSGVELRVVKVGVDRGTTFAMAQNLLRDKAAANADGKPLRGEGFYRSSRALIGREREDVRAYALLIQKPIPAFALNARPLFKCFRPGTGLGAVVSLDEFTDGGRFRRVQPDEADKGWTKIFDDAAKYCSHGPNCKHGAACTVGRRVEMKYVLTGSVLPFWTEIQRSVGYRDVARGGGGYTTKSNMRIVRLRIDATRTAAEERLVGVLIDESQLKALRRSIDGTGDDDSSDGGGGGAAGGGGGIKHLGGGGGNGKPNIGYRGAGIKPFGGGGGGGGASSSSSAGAGPSGVSSSSSSSSSTRGPPGGLNDVNGKPLAPGKIVMVKGLQSAVALQYNHATARVSKYAGGDDKRWDVLIATGKHTGTKLSAKGANLVIIG